VHLTEKVTGREESRRLHVCTVCFPCDSMSESEEAKVALRLFEDNPPADPEKPK
jgi:hypothetical protein